MKITYLTLFPSLMEGYFSDSILGRAKERGVFSVEFVNFREFSQDKHKRVDRPKIGGGAGMLLEPQPIASALNSVRKRESWVIFLTPAGKPFNQKDAKRLAKKEHLIFVCGRYEGFDERLIELYANEVLSLGDFVVTGGEVVALAMSDAILRNVEGVLGNPKSLEEESFEKGLLEAPAFTKPDSFEGKRIISEFLKGNHAKISALKEKLARLRSRYYRTRIADEK